jgi:hypothetical protein
MEDSSTMTDPVDLLCPRDADVVLDLTTSGVIRLARIGELPELRDSGGRRLFRRGDVEQLAHARRERRALLDGNGPAAGGLHDACGHQAAVNRVRSGGSWDRPTSVRTPKAPRK